MNTTKETQQHKDKEESKSPDPEWFQMDMSKLFQVDRIKKMGELMEEAAGALKDLKNQLEKAEK